MLPETSHRRATRTGRFEHITGVLNETRNVLAMMPHPERASEEILSSEDGKKVFMSMIAHIEQGKGVTS